jgi:hypothetical protein
MLHVTILVRGYGTRRLNLIREDHYKDEKISLLDPGMANNSCSTRFRSSLHMP